MSTPPPIGRVVFATDGSAHADAALAVVANLAWRPGTTIWVASVADVPAPPPDPPNHPVAKGVADWRRVWEMAHADARERATAVVAAAAARLRGSRPDVVVEEVVRTGEPGAELLAQIDAVGADLAVVGARGHTVLHGLLLGSVSEALVTAAPCPVLVVRLAPAAPGTVLVAVRTPEDADRLADLCLRLPLPPETRLVAATVSAPLPHPRPGHRPFTPGRFEALLRQMAEDDRAEAEAIGRRFVARIQAAQPERPAEARVVRGEIHPTLLEARGDVAPTLLREADACGAVLTVVGARECGGLSGRLGLGSVSRKLVRRAPGAVLVAREPAPDRCREHA